MQALLFIPWFERLGPWLIPLPWDGSLPIQPFGVLVATGVLLGAKAAEIWGRRNGVSPAAVSDMVGHVAILGFLGAYLLNSAFYDPAKLWEVVSNPAAYQNPFNTDDFKYLGLSSYGGFIGSIGGLLLWKWRRKLSMIAVGEAATFAFPLGWMFGRTGCFVTHDHPGITTDFFLAVDGYRVGRPPFLPRHDLGLYEVFWSAIVFGLFVWLARKPRRRGFFMALLPLTYGPVRFFLDYLRATPEAGGDVRYASLTPGQWGSVALLVLGMVLWWWIHNHDEPELPLHARYPGPDDDGADVDAAVVARVDGSPAGSDQAEPPASPDEAERPDV